MGAPIYLALDFPDWNTTNQFLGKHNLTGIPVKIGMELFYREGPALIEKLKKNDHSIFLDLKLHDIPTTVKHAMRNLAQLEVDMVNVHALGGGAMIQAAKQGLMEGNVHHHTKLLAVTILTSMDQANMRRDLRLPGSLASNVIHLAKVAHQNGADGVVCSVYEANAVKDACGSSFLTVTPGIRLANAQGDDQKRIATPEYAKQHGSSVIVVGRTVTQAASPKEAYEQIKGEWENGND
ncbi:MULTISPECIES: orotidine-5'-phosphate decarboxylase [Clostridia]|uniref:orotidine-5'-phosphate decarboxylase n=1 Tax=Clostridia TaxID=186801 RepID=UPI000EA0B28D|nr:MULTISPECIES: orotidine-5'-phosphate decarboxylase [Clostridia]NBJ68467.1 orotidine-5'-phosphate decarboxylase [Roseburia sp. 1XD42-34]RKI81227.1 orotidine-5'-phosphate decarboxylase [Clostridium sp. 1xD42-85]